MSAMEKYSSSTLLKGLDVFIETEIIHLKSA